MGLRTALTRGAASLATGRVHVLLAEPPGSFALRCAVERELARRGWVAAASPADADALLVTGPAPNALHGCFDVVWQQMPDPRVRAVVTAPGQVATVLDDLAARLADGPALRAAAAGRPDGPLPPATQEQDHGDMDHGDMDHGDMDHGDMEMAPHGVPLAGGGQDRDGLEMDVLRLRLGPVLRCWPPGLVMTATLHGDLVAEAAFAWLGGGRAAAGAPVTAARSLDAATGALTLAGAVRWAAEARSLRDHALDGGEVADAAASLHARVARSQLLRWSLGGDLAGGHGARPDVRHRLLHLLTLAADPADDEPLPDLVAGEDLAVARLLVAVSTPWADRLTPAGDPAGAAP